MSMFDNLSKQLSEVTVYDLKSYYNQAKNIVMNYTEMESKVREATNNDPWGTSSTAMEEIARGTHNFQLFNEIMPTIYKRFTEKEASEWRQIYKALQLLEYLVKNGSERVIDDARSHLSMIKILRSFHYIDEKAKDQGLNVRNRAKELAELLGDSERIRQERRKARANKSKYGGIEGGAGSSAYAGGFSSGFSSGGGSSSRYGGFGSDNAGGGYEGESVSDFYRTGGGSGGSTIRRESFEEYDAGDDDDRTGGSRNSVSRPSSRPSAPAATSKPTPAPPKPKEVNLFDFDDDEQSAPAPPTSAPKTAAPAATGSASLDDDFDDFQSATPVAAAAASAPRPSSAAPAAAAKPNFFDMMNTSVPSMSASSTPAPQHQAAASRPSIQGLSNNSFASSTSTQGGNFFSGMTSPPPHQQQQPMKAASSAFAPMAPAQSSAPAAQPTKPSNAFDDIWSMAGGGTTSSSASRSGGGGKTMAEMSKQKSDAQIWNSTGSSGGNSGGDLLF